MDVMVYFDAYLQRYRRPGLEEVIAALPLVRNLGAPPTLPSRVASPSEDSVNHTVQVAGPAAALPLRAFLGPA